MPAIPGSFDGQRIADKRTFYLTKDMQAHYRDNGEWEKIENCRDYGERCVHVTVRTEYGIRKDVWKYASGVWKKA